MPLAGRAEVIAPPSNTPLQLMNGPTIIFAWSDICQVRSQLNAMSLGRHPNMRERNHG